VIYDFQEEKNWGQLRMIFLLPVFLTRKVKRSLPIAHGIRQEQVNCFRVGIRAQGGLDSLKTPDQKISCYCPFKAWPEDVAWLK